MVEGTVGDYYSILFVKDTNELDSGKFSCKVIMIIMFLKLKVGNLKRYSQFGAILKKIKSLSLNFSFMLKHLGTMIGFCFF